MTILLLLLGCAPTPTPAAPPAPKAVTWSAIDGPGLTTLLTSPSDKVQVVNFWASWCGPCVKELPMLQDYARRRKNVDVVLVNVDSVAVQPRTVVPMITERRINAVIHRFLESDNPLPVLNKHVADWPGRIPLTTVITRQGERSATWVEELPLQALDKAVQTAVEGG